MSILTMESAGDSGLAGAQKIRSNLFWVTGEQGTQMGSLPLSEVRGNEHVDGR